MTINRAFLSGINSVIQLIFLSIYTTYTQLIEKFDRDCIFGVLCSDFFVRFAMEEKLLNTIKNSAFLAK